MNNTEPTLKQIFEKKKIRHLDYLNVQADTRVNDLRKAIDRAICSHSPWHSPRVIFPDQPTFRDKDHPIVGIAKLVSWDMSRVFVELNQSDLKDPDDKHYFLNAFYAAASKMLEAEGFRYVSSPEPEIITDKVPEGYWTLDAE